MGRTRKPTDLHILHGTARKARMAAREGELKLTPGDVGECPDWLSPEAKAEWHRLLDTEWARILSPAHHSAFLRYCVLQGRLIRSERGLKMWCDGFEHPENPEAMKMQELGFLHQFAMQLGLTPASQSKVQGKPKEQPKSGWAKFAINQQ